MRRTHSRGATLALTISLALGGAACGGSKGPATLGAPAPASAGDPSTTTTKSGKRISIEDQLGVDKAGGLARKAKVENLLRPCMKAQGFDYVPVDPIAREAALVGGVLSEEDFEKQFGYGITTLYEQRAQQAAGGPNETARAALDPSERKAYDRALLGEPGNDTYEAFDNGDFDKVGGCTKKAVEEAFGGAGLADTVQAQLEDLDNRLVADPRMRVAIKAWSACMRGRGHPLSDPGEVDSLLGEKLRRIVGAADKLTSEPGFDRAALTALQREEVALVGADIACEKEHITPVETRVRDELEVRFRETNADLLAKVPAP